MFKTDTAKFQSKRARFSDVNSGSQVKMKCAISIAKMDNDPQVLSFFRETHMSIFAALVDSIYALDTQKRGKHISEKEARNLLLVIKKLFISIPNEIREQKYWSSLLVFFEKALYVECLHSLRLFAYEALFQFMETLEKPDECVTRLVISSLNIAAFQRDVPDTRLPVSHCAPNKHAVLTPAVNSNPRRECVEMVDVFFSWAANTQTRFVLWFGMLCNVLAYFYPEICNSIGLSVGGQGFTQGRCPCDLQVLVLEHLARWLKNPELTKVLLGDTKFYHLLLEIYRLSLLMPSSYDRSIIMFTDIFISFLTHSPPNLDPSERSDLIVVTFDHLGNILNPTPTQSPQGFENLINLIIKHYNMNSQRLLRGNEMQERRQFLLTTIRCVSKMTSPDQPKENAEVITKMLPEFLNCVLNIWISHMILEESLWQQLQAVFEPATRLKHVVDALRTKLIHLTLVITDICYPYAEVKRADMAMQLQQQQQMQNEEGQGQGPTSRREKEWVSYDAWQNSSKVLAVRDPGLEHIAFTKENCYWIWNALFYVFHNVHKITVPLMYENCILVMSDLLNLFLVAEDSVALEPMGQKADLPRLPLHDVFGPGLFQAAADTSRSGGAAYALAALCRLFCRRFPILPLSILSHFYYALQKGFMSRDRSIIWRIIGDSYTLFSIGLEGCSVMIPSYLGAISDLLLNTNNTPVASFGYNKCLILLTSIISYPSHYREMVLPSVGSAEQFTAAKCRESLYRILVSVIDIKFPSEILCSAIWALAIAFAEEAHNWGGEHCRNIAVNLLQLCSHETEDVIICACNSISFAVSEFPDSPVTTFVIDSLCSIVREFRCPLPFLHHVYFALLRILVGGKRALITRLPNEIIKNAFGAINLGLRINELPAFAKEPPKEPQQQKKGKGETARSSINMNSQPQSLVQEASAVLLAYLLHFHRFPLSQGVTVECSQVDSDERTSNEAATHWLFNNSAVVSVSDLPGSVSRLTLRNVVGKWTWDFTRASVPADIGIPDDNQTFDRHSEFSVMNSLKDKTTMNTIVCESPPGTTPLSKRNKLFEVCDNIEGEYPELSRWASSLVDPTTVLSSELSQNELSAIGEMEKFLAGLEQEEAHGLTSCSNKWQTFTAPPTLNSQRDARLLLQQLGFIDPRSPFPARLLRIPPSDRFFRTLTALDSVAAREHHKFGLVYVRELQETQSEILANKASDGTSDLYDAFVHGLGWRVWLNEHKGYLGGLDKKSCGDTSLYYSDALTEIMFHEIVSMPASSDPQHLSRKRHVGNDFVHFVWSEHVRNYAPGTIVSQFNEARIVAYPLANGMVGIQLFRKPTLPLLGPLQHGIAVNADLLPLFARETGIDASRYITEQLNHAPYFLRIYMDRQRLISSIAEKFIAETSHFQEMSIFFSDSPTTQTQSLPTPKSPTQGQSQQQSQSQSQPLTQSQPQPQSQPQRTQPQAGTQPIPPPAMPIVPPQMPSSAPKTQTPQNIAPPQMLSQTAPKLPSQQVIPPPQITQIATKGTPQRLGAPNYVPAGHPPIHGARPPPGRGQ